MASDQQCEGDPVIHSETRGEKEIRSLLHTRHKNQFQVDWRPKRKRQRHLTWLALGPAKNPWGKACPSKGN